MIFLNKAKFSKILYILSFVLLCVFVFLEHIDFMRGIKNASLYLALFLALLYSYFNPKISINNIFENFKIIKIPIILASAFIACVFMVSSLPYDENYPSLFRAFRHFGRAIAFLLIILLMFNGDKKPILWIFFSFLAAFIFGSFDDLYSLISSFENLSAKDYSQAVLVRRSYADFVDRFLPLGLCALLTIKNTRLIMLLAIFAVILPLILDIFTGARGSWLACALSLVLFMILTQKAHIKAFLSKHFKIFSLALLVIIMAFGALISQSTVLKYKLTQGFDSSGRTLIIKERFSAIANAKRLAFGLGYGKEQYDSALIAADNLGLKTAKKYATIDNGRQNYWNDEPFFLGYFYYYGVFGALFIFGLFLSVLVVSFNGFLKTKNPLFLAVFLSVLAYFGLRGLFECYNLRVLYLFYLLGFLIMLLREKNEKCANC